MTRRKGPWWVIDVFRKERIGPFNRLRDTRREVSKRREIADMFLEISTNIGVCPEAELDKWDVKEYTKVEMSA